MLATACPRCVTRQRRERGILARSPRRCSRLRKRETWALRQRSWGTHGPKRRRRSSRFRKPCSRCSRGDGERRGVERTRRTALTIAYGLDEAVEGALGGRGIIDDGEGIEIAMVGRRRHGVAQEIRDALGQGCHPRVRRPRRPHRPAVMPSRLAIARARSPLGSLEFSSA